MPFAEKLARHSPLSETDREAILALPHTMKELEKGEYLYREGEAAPNCCVILSGYVAKQKFTGNGKRQIIAIHMKGDGIGFQNALVAHPDHDAQVLSHLTAAFMSTAAISRLNADFPGAARAIWVEMLVDAAIQREWTVNLGAREARSRIAHLLCELAVRQERADIRPPDGYEMALTQEQLADATGLTAIHVNRVLQDLRREGVIGSVRKGAPLTCDWERMTEVAGFTTSYLEVAAGSRCAGEAA